MSASTEVLVTSTVRESDGRTTRDCGWACSVPLRPSDAWRRLASLHLGDVIHNGRHVTLLLGAVDSQKNSEAIGLVHTSLFDYDSLFAH